MEHEHQGQAPVVSPPPIAWTATATDAPEAHRTPMQRAAAGDLQAQRDMVYRCFDLHRAGSAGFAEAVTWAEFWARLAHAHGHNVDRALLMSVLALAAQVAEQSGDVQRMRLLTAEGIALADTVADADDEMGMIAETALPWLLEEADPDLIALAKTIRRECRV